MFLREVVAGVELKSGLVGGKFKEAAAGGVVKEGCRMQALAIVVGEAPTVVISEAKFEGFKVVCDPFADGAGAAEVHGRVGYGRSPTSGNEADVGGKVFAGFDFQFVFENGAGEVAREIPVGVIDQVDRSGCVGGGGGLEDEFVVAGEPVGDFCGKVSGVSFFSVIRVVGEADSAGIGANDGLAAPKSLVVSF